MQVEDTLFKAPRCYFEQNSTDSIFHYTVGLSDQQPLRLDGIAAAEFRYLLRAMIRK